MNWSEFYEEAKRKGVTHEKARQLAIEISIRVYVRVLERRGHLKEANREIEKEAALLANTDGWFQKVGGQVPSSEFFGEDF